MCAASHHVSGISMYVWPPKVTDWAPGGTAPGGTRGGGGRGRGGAAPVRHAHIVRQR